MKCSSCTVHTLPQVHHVSVRQPPPRYNAREHVQAIACRPQCTMLIAAFQLYFTMVDTQDSCSFCILLRKGKCISGSQFLLLCFIRLRWWCYLLIIDALFRYEDLKQQLLSAQNLAEQEGDQEQLARAAAAVARLTFPSSGVVDTSARPSVTVLHTLH